MFPALQPSPMVFVVSDSLGETAERVVTAAASQFGPGAIRTRRFAQVKTESDLLRVIEEASACGQAIIAYTLVVPELRNSMRRLAAREQLAAVDILGPILEALARAAGVSPSFEPGLVHRLDDDYFRRMEAIEYAVLHDDGKNPSGLAQADLVLIGVSRVSKTPLSMYLAHKLLKVGNVPLVPEVSLPPELLNIPPMRVIGLTLSPAKLLEIRKERLRHLGLPPASEYAATDRILEELEFGREVMRRLGCRVIDVTTKAVEETAGLILGLLVKA